MLFQKLIRQYLAEKFQVPEIPVSLKKLSQQGFQPNLIFDVGAYQGDFAKYCIRIWPNTKVVCFEALEHKVSELQRLASENSQLQVFPVLLGAQPREKVPLHQVETASSILVEHTSQDFQVTFHPMKTIDQIVEENFAGRSPDFLKIDVQGYELEVLKGAETSLPEIKVILAEVNLLDIHQNVPLLAELVTWLNERNWVAYDICGLTRRPLDKALWQADFIFVPRNSPCRSDKRWAA